MPKLTDQQRNFCLLYVKNGFDQSAAAMQAGYSEKNASSIASKLLNKVQVKAEIDRLCGQIEEKVTVEAAEIIQGLRKIAFAPQSDRVNNSDRLRALELLGKYLALFSERLAVERTDGPEAPQMGEDEAAQWKQAASQIGLKLASGS